MSSVSFDGREFQKISSGFADHRIPTNRNSIINKPSWFPQSSVKAFSMYHKTWPSESCCDHHNLSENVKFSDIFYMSSRLKADFFNIKEGFSPQISAIFGNLGRDIPLNLWIRLLAPPQIVMARRISYPRQLSANSAVTFSLPLHRKYPAPS